MTFKEINLRSQYHWSRSGFRINGPCTMFLNFRREGQPGSFFHPYQIVLKQRIWVRLLKKASNHVNLSLDIPFDYVNVNMLKDIFEEHNLGLDISLFIDWLPYATKECYDKDFSKWIRSEKRKAYEAKISVQIHS